MLLTFRIWKGILRIWDFTKRNGVRFGFDCSQEARTSKLGKRYGKANYEKIVGCGILMKKRSRNAGSGPPFQTMYIIILT